MISRRVALCLLFLAGCQQPSDLDESLSVGITGMTMGTLYSVKVDRLPEKMTADQLKTEIDAELERLNDLMSTYRPESEVSRFSKSTETGWFEVSPETATVVAESLRISRLSGGAFDITVAPLVELWNFGPNAGEFRIPPDEEILAAQERVGFASVEVRLDPPALRKSRPDVTLDLSAIAKGFGVDQIAGYLLQKGVGGYMVEIGGETRTYGTKQDGTPWRIGIQKPVAHELALQKTIEPGDRALATSGDYRNFFEKDGRRYSHTIDPRTGHPIEFHLASVSVVTEMCMTADALATAITVLGPDAGYDLAVEQNLAALLIVRTNDGFEEKATPEFLRLFGQDQ